MKNLFLKTCVVALLALSSACSAAPTATPSPQPSPAASATPALYTATPALYTATPAATFAGLPLAQVTPVTTPGSGWKTFSAAGVTFSAPPAWKELSPGAWEGSDGFATLSSQALDGAAPGAACLGEANRAKPGRFGQYPEIRDLYQAGVQTGCLILPSPDQPAVRRNEALLLRWSSSARLMLRADRAHIEALAASLKIEDAGPAASSNCDYSIQSQPPRTSTSGGLTITEYAVASAPAGSLCDPLADPPAFNRLASSGNAAARTARIVNEQFSSQRLARLNQQLAAFGVRVRVIERRFAIDQNGVKLHANLSWLGPLTIQDGGGAGSTGGAGNTGGADFRLPVVDGYDGGNFILSQAGLQRQEGWDILLYDRVFPIFVGSDLLSLAYDYSIYPRQVNNPALLNISKNGQVIDTWSVSGSTLDGGPVRGLWAWQEHWLLELPGIVLEDGESLNERLGYSEVFTWRLINDRPFYFFRKAGQVQLSYDEQVLAPVYNEVLYQPLGGSAILLELKAFETGLFFYARRGDTWYYVTIES